MLRQLGHRRRRRVELDRLLRHDPYRNDLPSRSEELRAGCSLDSEGPPTAGSERTHVTGRDHEPSGCPTWSPDVITPVPLQLSNEIALETLPAPVDVLAGLPETSDRPTPT